MDSENAIHTLRARIDALTLTVTQPLGELPRTHRKLLADRIWAKVDGLPESVERDNVLIELVGEPRR
jgi:hypothetical protein